jgi:uncharacterized protein (TIGR02145 family)
MQSNKKLMLFGFVNFTDFRDAKSNNIVKIGSQAWFAENLTHKPDNGNFWSCNNDTSNFAKY